MLCELKKRGDYAIALLHENNRTEDLSGAAYAITDIEELSWDSFEKAYQRMAGKPWKIVETERCVIRETIVEDVENFTEYMRSRPLLIIWKVCSQTRRMK